MSSDPGEGAVKQQSVQRNDTSDGHKHGLGFSRVWLRISGQQMCFTAPPLPFFFLGSSAGEHQPGVNKRHYVPLIILNKYVDTNMTRSPPDDLWRAFWQLNSFVQPVCAADIWRELRSIRPIIGGRTAKSVTQIYMTNEERRERRKHLMLTKIRIHAPCARSDQRDTTTGFGITGQHFWHANFAGKISLQQQTKGGILGTVG